MNKENKFRSTRPKGPGKPEKSSGLTPEQFARKLKAQQGEAKTEFDYRSASLKIHGSVCARCGKDFSGKELKMLTVHHKDGDHQNNPRDGSNWENLCIYCHDAEHSRELLADWVDTASGGKGLAAKAVGESGQSTLGDLLKAAMEKKK